MKIVELLIDENEDIIENGGTAIALVNHPAHETEFFQFNADGKVIELNEEEQDIAFQQFSELGENHNEFMMKGYYIKNVEMVGEYINAGLLNEKFNTPSFKEVMDKSSILDTEVDGVKTKVRFKYAVRPGRPAILTTSRQFCKDMMNANAIYRLEDINKINNGFAAKYGKSSPSDWGNTFFRFGGPNCGHIWIKLTYQEIFKDNKKVKDQLIDTESRDDAALIAGTNMNDKTLANPSPNTPKRAGLGQFSAQQLEKFAEEQKKKQLIAGPILIPDKMIYRFDKNSMEEYYCYFTKDTTEKIAYKYLRDKNQSNINLEHNPNKTLDDVSLVESWIVTDPENDKSNQFGYSLPEGTWFGIVQVKDKDVFEKYVESGQTRGFSLEGFFESKLVKFNNSKIDIDTYILSEIEKLISD